MSVWSSFLHDADSSDTYNFWTLSGLCCTANDLRPGFRSSIQVRGLLSRLRAIKTTENEKGSELLISNEPLPVVPRVSFPNSRGGGGPKGISGVDVLTRVFFKTDCKTRTRHPWPAASARNVIVSRKRRVDFRRVRRWN